MHVFGAEFQKAICFT